MDNNSYSEWNIDGPLVDERDEIEKIDQDFDVDFDEELMVGDLRIETNEESSITSIASSFSWTGVSPVPYNRSSPTLQFPSGGSCSDIPRPVPIRYTAAEPLPAEPFPEGELPMPPISRRSNYVSSPSVSNLLETDNSDWARPPVYESDEIDDVEVAHRLRFETNEESNITSVAPSLTWTSVSSASYRWSSPTLQSPSGGNGGGIQNTAPPSSPILRQSTIRLFPEPNRQVTASWIPRSSSLSSQSSIWTSWSSPTNASVRGSPAMLLPRPASFPAQNSTPTSATLSVQARTSTPASAVGQYAAPDNGSSSGLPFSSLAHWQAMLAPRPRSSSVSSQSSTKSSSSSQAAVSGRASPQRRGTPSPSGRRERRTLPSVKVFVKKPEDNDVKLGKGSGSYKHAGNISLRQRAGDLRARYKSADIRTKNKIKHELIHWVQKVQNGRFLEHDPESRRWYIASEKTVKDIVVILLGRATK